MSQKDNEIIAIANGPNVNQCEFYMMNKLSLFVFVLQDKRYCFIDKEQSNMCPCKS